MKDIYGTTIRMGHRLALSASDVGVVVCDIDGSEYSNEYSESSWSYLGEGIMVVTEQAGLMHLTQENSKFEKPRVLPQ